jgi:hypothetical protein
MPLAQASDTIGSNKALPATSSFPEGTGKDIVIIHII